MLMGGESGRMGWGVGLLLCECLSVFVRVSIGEAEERVCLREGKRGK